MKKLKGKALDKEIERVFYTVAEGVQINVMDIGKVFAAGRAGYERDGDVRAALVDVVAKLRRN